jgi:hypothetical protein
VGTIVDSRQPTVEIASTAQRRGIDHGVVVPDRIGYQEVVGPLERLVFDSCEYFPPGTTWDI